MSVVRLADMTMRQSGKNVHFSLNFREKLELAKLLDRLGVSVIEVSAFANPKVDRLLVKSICSAVKDSTVAVSVGLNEENIAPVRSAMEECAHPRLQVTAPVSAVQMEYLAGKKPAAMLETITRLVSACRAVCADVELIAEDATRADSAFLYDAVRAAIAAGASTVTLCDAAGNMLPDQFASFINDVKENVPELAQITLGVACSNDLSMADSCAVSAIRCGVGEIKCAAHAVNTVNLGNVARILAVKGTDFDAATDVTTTQMNRTLAQISRLCESERSENSPFDNGVQAADGTFLTVHDDITAVMKAVNKLGYDLSEEDSVKVFEAFGRIAAKKETVNIKELDAIVASAAMQVPSTYKLESYVINTGNTISATAHMKLNKNGVMLEGISLGDGPIDAAFLAVEQIAGRHYELDDFQIQAVTEGHEAMGEAVVKLRNEGKLFSGRGISTDIVGASIHAYISALNKIVYEEAAL